MNKLCRKCKHDCKQEDGLIECGKYEPAEQAQTIVRRTESHEKGKGGKK